MLTSDMLIKVPSTTHPTPIPSVFLFFVTVGSFNFGVSILVKRIVPLYILMAKFSLPNISNSHPTFDSTNSPRFLQFIPSPHFAQNPILLLVSSHNLTRLFHRLHAGRLSCPSVLPIFR